MKSVLIIGGTGSVGYYLSKHLTNCGFKVSVTGSKKRSSKFFASRKINYHQLDITNKDSFNSLKEDFDSVIHLAGLMPARMEGYNPASYFEVNTIGTLNVLEFCRIKGISQILFALSHSDVAGHWNTGKPIPEDAMRLPNLKGDHAVYIISKMAAADLTTHYFLEYGIKNVILRFPTIYCYWPVSTMYVDGKKTIIPYLHIIEKAKRGETIEVWGDPKHSKDIVYVKDLTHLIENIVLNNDCHGTYNVGTENPISLEEQILKTVEIFSPDDNKSKMVYRPEKSSQAQFTYEISKSIKDFGYTPKYSIEKMLKDMKDEMESNQLIDFLKDI